MKNNTMKLFVLFAVIFMLPAGIINSQVRIGNNESPAKGAILDLNNQDEGYVGGLVLPNVFIEHVDYIPSSFTSNSPNEKALAGMIVYNTNDNLTSDSIDNKKAGGKGVYVWDGEKWLSLFQTKVDGDDYETPNVLPGEIPDLIDVDEYNPDTKGYAYIKGISCLSIEPGYDENVDKKDNLYRAENRVQTYTLTGDLTKLNQETVRWRIVPKDYGSRDAGEYIDSVLISPDNMSCTIYYSPDAAQSLEDGINELCPANKNGKCFVRVAIYVYYNYGGEKLIAQKTCYYQNYSCCNGYICEGCAYDYKKNNTPGDWARVGNPSDNAETSLVTVYASGPWGSEENNGYIDEAFGNSVGDLCVYKKDGYIQNNWAAAILDCQDGDFTDGRDDWGWYVPNLKEQVEIYRSAMQESGLTVGQGYWWPDIFAEDLFGDDSDAQGLRHAGYFTSTETSQSKGGLTHPTHTTIFNMGDGSAGTAPKNLASSAIKYRVRCVRRID